MNEKMLLDPINASDWDALIEAGRETHDETRAADAAVLSARAAVRRAATTERLRTRRTRRTVMAGVAAAALVAASVVVGVTSLPIGGPDSSTPAAEAADVLERAAQVTLAASDPVVGAGEFLKVVRVQDSWEVFGSNAAEQLGADGKTRASKTRTRLTLWIPQDTTQDWIVRFSPEQVLERVSTSTPRRDDAGSTQTFEAAYDELGYRSASWYAGLPLEPAALMTALRAASGAEGTGSAYDFSEIYSEVLRDPMAPATVRAALFEGLSEVEGFSVIETTTPHGRPGVSVGYDGDFSQRMVFDTATGEFVGEVNRNLEMDFAGGPTDNVNLAVTWTREVVDAAPSAD